MQIENIEKQILSQFIENIPQFVWWKDLNSIFLGCNNNFAKCFGLKSTAQIIGLTDYDILENKKDANSVREIDQEIIATGKPQLNFEEHLTLPNTGKRWLSTSKIPLYDDNKNIVGTIGWFNDITEIKELKIELTEKNKVLFEYSLELNAALRNLEIVNLDLEQLLYAASNTLEAPLLKIKNSTQLLLKDDNLSQASILDANSISKALNKLQSFVNDINYYTMSGSRNLAANSVNINEIVALKVMEFKSADKSEERIKLNLPKTKIKVYKELIGLVFYNLINNAITLNNSSTLKIKIDYSETKDFWYFTVEDNGVGIKSINKEDIFKPYNKTKQNYSKELGIGLSICKRVIALHKGEIWLEKSEKEDTIFKFSISKHL